MKSQLKLEGISMLILCLVWSDKDKCLVAKLKFGLAIKLDNVSTKIYTVSVKL